MATISFILGISLLFALYTVFGMTLLPAFLRTDANKETGFLLSPLLGASVWIAFTVAPAWLLPYNKITLCIQLFLALLWCIYRRKSIFLPSGKSPYLICLTLAIFSVCVSRLVYPFKIDGGLYFNFAIYDHVRCAIVNSIANFGIPPVNPWLAENGASVPMLYYFGWYAWAAQIPIFTGLPALWSECCMTGFSMLLCTTALTGIGRFYGLKQKRFGFLFLLFYMLLIFSSQNVVNKLLPGAWLKYLAPNAFIGFWDNLNNFVWSPHHTFSGAIVILIFFFYLQLLNNEDKKTKLSLMILLSFLASTAILTSIYAGGFGLVYFAISIILIAIFQKEFRQKILANWLPQLIAVALFLLMTASYHRYMTSYSSENFPLAFGMMKAYGNFTGSCAQLRYILSLFFYVFPNNLGLTFVIALMACFLPRFFPKTETVLLVRTYIAVSLLSIILVHSSFYSNDFGWRSFTACYYLFVLFAAYFTATLFKKLEQSGHLRKTIGFCIAILVFVFELYLIPDFFKTAGLSRKYPEMRIQFAKSVKGWDIIHQHTKPHDLVQCNPRSFYEIGLLYDIKEYSTNVFFSLYSKRPTAIGDLIFAKCYSEFYPQAKLEEQYNRVCNIFAGNPTPDDIDYLADTLKIQAVLVTPYDGIWNAPAPLLKRYPRLIEAQDFKVFLRK